MSNANPASADPLPPQAQLLSLSLSHFVNRAVCLTAELGIPDLLAAGPKRVDELARETKTEARALGRMLRLVATLGIIREIEPSHFALGPLGEYLRSDVPGSLRAWVRMTGSDYFYRTLSEALDTLRTGRPSFDKALGVPFFDYLAQHPERSAVFNRAMDDHGRGVSAAVVDAYDFSGISRVVDVGGGHGTLIQAILKAHPKMTGILFDAPHVAESARRVIAEAGLGDRCAVEGGDFFRAVPRDADAYLLRWIIHDWEHDLALTILRNCRSAMKKTGRVLLVEAIVPPSDEPHPSKVFDFVMLTGLGGQERTEKEYAALLREADLRLARVVPTASPMSILEAVGV